MCLGVPGRVIEVGEFVATVDFFGVRRQVRLELVDQPVAPGDYILNHVGYAIRRIPEDDIEGTLALYEQLLREASDNPEDLMAADVSGELAATSHPAPSERQQQEVLAEPSCSCGCGCGCAGESRETPESPDLLTSCSSAGVSGGNADESHD